MQSMTSESTPIGDLERRVSDAAIFNHAVAHELRGPLQSMSGHARLIEIHDGQAMSPQGRGHLRRILDLSAHMQRLIGHLLALAGADSIELQREPVAVDAIVRVLVAEMKSINPHARVVVGELPAIDADAAIVRQVFANVICNALKFSRNVEAPLVQVGLAADGAFTVQDNGIGFAMANAANLFEPLVRLSDDPAYPGSGLGLSIVQRLLARHGGWITAHSRPGGPTEFRFCFSRE
jgi:signal transduction histidine kinase